MFSRSDKSDEATDVVTEPSGQRGPMVMAALAGLLAIAGAFLLVSYVSGSDADEAIAAAADGDAETVQVLTVLQTIPAGTSVREILETPTVYLTARTVNPEFVLGSAVTTMEELEAMIDLTLDSDVHAGEQLLAERFVNRSNFENEAFIERVSAVDAPDGHHQVVLTLPATRALGGLVRAGDEVTIVGGFRVDVGRVELEDGDFIELDPYELSVVVLNVVEVINVQVAGIEGQVATDAELVGVANQGSYNVTIAVEPDELTDLTFAMEYGEITLAAALPGATNDDLPRAATTINQIVGDNGVWVAEIEDDQATNKINLLGIPGLADDDIAVEFPTGDGAEDDEAAADSADAESTAGES